MAWGFKDEADPRQAERLIHDLDLSGPTNGCATPGVKVQANQAQAEVELPERDHTKFRGDSARGNYLSADRPGIISAAKEICRFMSKPTDVTQVAVKRLGRYLRRRPRLVWQYPYQRADRLEVYSDADWAGCVRTRKSASGGCLMLGALVLKTWSATQASLALSSGEAQCYGVVKAAGVGLGMPALFRDIGLDIPIRFWTDASAAVGICGRQGLGKLRHLACQTLWVQQRVRQGDFELRKVRGDENPADLFTEHMDSEDKLVRLVQLFGGAFVDGQAAAAPALPREAVVNDVETLGLSASPSVGASTRTTTITDDDNNDGPRNPDTSILAHELTAEDVETFFPRAPFSPAPLGEADEEPDPDCEDPGPFKRSGVALSAKTIAERRSQPPKAKGGSLEPKGAVTVDEPYVSPITASSSAGARTTTRESNSRASTGCVAAAPDANTPHSALHTCSALEVPRPRCSRVAPCGVWREGTTEHAPYCW